MLCNQLVLGFFFYITRLRPSHGRKGSKRVTLDRDMASTDYRLSSCTFKSIIPNASGEILPTASNESVNKVQNMSLRDGFALKQEQGLALLRTMKPIAAVRNYLPTQCVQCLPMKSTRKNITASIPFRFSLLCK